jgi:carbon monoxide dehydrogenase subunit G
MKVELEKTFPMPATATAAWAFLQNIEGVAGCMPGAKITERVDATHYKGTISVRVGPASMAFKGELEVLELNAAQRTLHLVGKGSDTTGSSGASMDLLARIEPGTTENVCNLVGRSEVTMSGKAAAFGGRMMGSVADQILKQFAANFASQVKSRAEAASAQTDGAPAAAASPVASAARNTFKSNTDAAAQSPVASAARNTFEPNTDAAAQSPVADAARNTFEPNTDAAAQSPLAGAARNTFEPNADAAAQSTVASVARDASGSGADAAHHTSEPSAEAPSQRPVADAARPASAPPAPANELNALALLWAIVRDWFRGLFRRKAA